MNWDLNPRDQRRTDPDPERKGKSPHKDTKRWCRGKVGVEHVVEIKRRGYGMAQCDWYSVWHHFGPESLSDQHYRCQHRKVCAVCGKVLGRIEVQDCPDLAQKIRPAPRHHPKWEKT